MLDLPVLVDVTDDIATITLNRPRRLNAFTSEMLDALDAAVDRLNDDLTLAGVIVTGAGRGFCSGRDLAELGQIGQTERRKAVPGEGGHESSMFARIQVPTVAAVNGPAVGGGLGFVVQCDYVLAAREALFDDGHLRAGMAPSVASWYVPRRIGAWRAIDFFARTQPTPADAALELGLVDEVVELDSLMETARRRLEPFRAVDRELLRHTKLLAVRAATAPFDGQMERVGLLRSMERRARAGG